MKPSEVWQNYWKSKNVSECELSTQLRSYQIPIYRILKKTIEKNNIKFILSAGAGEDLISLNLQRYFKNKLQVTILDISGDVLIWNKKLFRRYNLDAQFIRADIFQTSFGEDSFDLVFNTGVVEHFEKDGQIKMVKELLRVLKPGGLFITANPSDGGKLYKLGMEAAKKKEIWSLGREVPVKSLCFLQDEISQIDSIKEFHKDFLTQLGFLSYVHPLFRLVTLPAKLLGRLPPVLPVYDFMFSKIFGTYLIFSIVKKK